MAELLNQQYEPTERHRAVVEHGDGLLVVVAGPGTGKTFSLLRKIESLIKIGVDPSQIYYLTFVNSIVDAFKEDVRKSKEQGGLGVDPVSLGIHVSTLHSLAFKIVSAYSDHLQLAAHQELVDLSPKPQSVLSQVFVDDLFDYAKTLNIVQNKKSFNTLLKQLGHAWRSNQSPTRDCGQLANAAQSLCARYEVCPWDLLVQHAIRAIQEQGLPTWLQNAQHFLIDEYQDFNPSEQRLLALITEPSNSVIIVGDPDQSIYSGRSASPKGLLDLLARDDAKSVNFVYCRRCPKRVLAAANNLLKHMDPAGYAKKELQPYRQEEGEFTIKPFMSCKAEIEDVAATVLALDEADRKDTVILLSQRKVAEYYATKLNDAGVLCTVKSLDTEAEFLEAVLRLVALHHHPFLERLLLLRFKDVERKYKSEVLQRFLSGEETFGDTLVQSSEENNWRSRVTSSLASLTDTVAGLASGESQQILSALQDLSLEVEEATISCILESDPKTSARVRVTSCLRLLDGDQDASGDSNAPLEIMTMHSAKGLSKQLVIIPAFEEKLLPGDSTGDRLEEIHRLVYVAITRAKGKVLITFPKSRARKDPLNYGSRPRLSRYAAILQGDRGQ